MLQDDLLPIADMMLCSSIDFLLGKVFECCRLDGSSIPLVSGRGKHVTAPKIAVTPNTDPEVISDNDLTTGGAAIWPNLDIKDKIPNTEFLIDVGNNSTPYKKTMINERKKKQLHIQAIINLIHVDDASVDITTIIKIPDRKHVDIRKVRLYNLFSKITAANVPGSISIPEMATFLWISLLIPLIYSDTP